MAPRRYRLTTRAVSTAATRHRIVKAAAAEYQKRGFRIATLSTIAARAGVSRGSILHHFRDADGLLGAVLDDMLVTLEVPDARLLEGAEGAEERARRFVDAMLRFYDRTSEWWTVFGPEIDNPAVRAREAVFWEVIGAFRSAALGSAADDRVLGAAVDTLTHPATVGLFRSRDVSLDEAIETFGDLVVNLLRRHGLAGP